MSRWSLLCLALALVLLIAVAFDRSTRTEAVQTVPTPAGQLGGAPSLTEQPDALPPTPEATATVSLDDRVATLEARVDALEATVSAVAGSDS